MRPIFVSPAAEQDIESILRWTHEHFGEPARLRYEALLVQAISDVAENPERPGSCARAELAAAARTYHLYYSRTRVARVMGRANRPRHLLLYRTHGDGSIELGRVLHDSMDFQRQLPEEYRCEVGEE